MFRPDSTDPDVISRWIGSGATHHHALLIGNVGDQLQLVARTLNLDGVAV
jgi:hypothetical protein